MQANDQRDAFRRSPVWLHLGRMAVIGALALGLLVPASGRAADDASEAENLSAQGTALYRQGQYALALPLATRALAIREKVLGPEHADTANGLSNLAGLRQAMGQYAQALSLYARALAIRERVLGPEHADTANGLSNLAGVHQAMGQYAQALPLYQRALAIREQVLGPEHANTATSLNNLANLHRTMGQYAQARPLYTRALTIREKVLGPEHADTATSLNDLAVLHQTMGQYTQALPLYTRALAINEKVLGPEHAATATSLNNLANLHRTMGQYAQALPLHMRALRIAQRAGKPDLVWAANGNLMEALSPTKPVAGLSPNKPLATWHGKQAVNALQSVRANLQSLDAGTQQSFLKLNSWYYNRLADLLIEQGRIPEAEQVLAMLKERELSELTQRSELRRTTVSDVGLEQTVSRESDELSARGVRHSTELAALERRKKFGETLGATDEARLAELQKAVEAWQAEFERWQQSLPQRFAAAGVRGAEPDPAQQAQRLQTLVRAEPNAVGLHYVVTDERIAIIVSTARGSFGRYSNVPRSALNARIGQFRRAIVARDGSVLEHAQALYRMLITPVEQDLKDAQAGTLVLSLTDVLRYLPFAALHDGQQYLVQRHALSLHASAGGVRPQASDAAWQVAALGVTQARQGYPALPGVASELNAIVKTGAASTGVLPGSIALDEAFGQPQLNNAVLQGRYSVVHLASHFNFVPGDESRSALLLGTGEPMPLKTLRAMDFSSVQQLTLSACDTATGGGTNENGMEVEGLAAAVQQQGAQAVLMQRFYQARAGAKPLSRAQALRQAQLQLLGGRAALDASPAQRSADAERGVTAAAPPPGAAGDPSRPWAHPYFWAPFVLSGNWM